VAAPVTRSVERPRGDGLDPLVVCMAHGQGGAEIAEDRAPTLTCNHEAPIACYAFQPRIARNGRGDMGDIVNALTAQAGETGKGDAAPCVAIAIGFDSRQDPVSSEHVAGALGSGRSQAQAVCVAIPLQEVGKRTGVSTSDIRAGLGIGDDGDPMFTLQATAQHGVAMCVFDPNQITNPNNRSNPTPGLCHTLPAVVTPPVLYGTRMAVRRLTPVECERLQGFPDGWTAVVYRGKQAADGPRYKALGNSMAVPCMAFLGRRIAAYFNGELIRGLC
jgi:DNA (cytosine-5)-methyltransferase 1